MPDFKKENYKWDENLTEDELDHFLSKYHGHPLQSAKWGNSKKLSTGIKDHRWAALKNGLPVFIARFEERSIFKFFKVAWCPKGPLVIDKVNESTLHEEFLQRLKKKGFIICATNPWEKIELVSQSRSVFYTVWVDLTLQKEKLWENLHKKCRSDIKRAKKLGVVIEKSESLDDLRSFYKICESISKSKGFNLGSSLQLMMNLISNLHQEHVESSLFVARYEGNLCGGAFIMRCGKSIHYLWGGVNREFSHLCIGEATLISKFDKVNYFQPLWLSAFEYPYKAAEY